MDLVFIRDLWVDGDQMKFQIIGDNWDKNILLFYRILDRKIFLFYFFNMYVIVDWVVLVFLINFLIENRLEFDNLKFILLI